MNKISNRGQWLARLLEFILKAGWSKYVRERLWLLIPGLCGLLLLILSSQILPSLASVRGEDGSMKRTETDAVSVLHSAHTLGVCMATQVWVAFVNVIGKGCLLFVFGFYLFIVELAAAWLIKNLY